MRCLKRNQQAFYYCLYESSDNEIVDDNGNLTGQYIIIYHEPIMMYANISQATGQSNTEQFGNLDNYDKVIVTCDMDCPIDENSVLFIDKEPEFTEVMTNNVTEGYALYADDEIEPVTVQVPAYDYIVRRVARSLNSISIAVQKVKVS